MGLFEHFPYTNYHELNILWIIRNLKFIMENYGKYSVAYNDAAHRAVISFSTADPEEV